MRFSDVIGQGGVKNFLLRMAASDRVPNALLLLGQQGTGNLPLALAFSQYLLCKDPSAEDACGQCPSCLKAGKYQHPDIHFVFPTIGSKEFSDHFLPEWREALADNAYLNSYNWLKYLGGEGKQGNITAAECVQIIRKLSLKTFESRFKIMILWLPEYLGKEGNRLLKILEEPPEQTVFLLVAEDQEQILNTILSRCQLVKVPDLPDSDIEAALVERYRLRSDKARALAHLADGNFDEALKLKELSENEEGDLRSDLFLDWLRKCYKGNGLEIMDWVEDFSKVGRENQKFLLRYGLHFLREFTFLLATGRDDLRLLPEELDTAKKMQRVIDFGKVDLISQLFSDCSYYVERNANPKILFLDASIRLNRILRPEN